MTAILEITDGTTTIDLLSTRLGWHLDSWIPAISQLKGGGIYQDSNIAPGRRLTYGVSANANEVFNLKVNSQSQNELIQQAQDLLRLLEKARNYWLTRWQDTPVYVKAQSSCEDNVRYALIHNYSLANLDNPYAQPFFTAGDLVAMDGLGLGIERGHWLATIPGGSGECVEITQSQEWIYEALWREEATLSSTVAFSFLTAANGDIYAGLNDQIQKSTDNGDSWATNSTDPGGNVEDMIQASNGNIIASDSDGVDWYTTNNGTSWNNSTFPEPETGRSGYFVELPSGVILLFSSDDDSIASSSDYGVNFTLPFTHPFAAGADGATILTDGSLLVWAAASGNGLWRSTDNGANWSQLVIPETRIDHAIQLANGNIYATSTNKIYITDDITQPFGLLVAVSGAAAFNWVTQASNGDVYLSDSNPPTSHIYRSVDDMLTNIIDYSRTAENISQITEGASGVIVSGSNDDDTNGAIFRRLETSIELGIDEAICDNEVYIANKQNVANLTDIKISDGGVFSNIFPATLPQTLLPAVPATNDALYFGIDTSVTNSGPFSSLVFDLSVTAVSTTSYTIIWEYWSGATWATLTTQDNTSQLALIGVNSVHWAIPSDWATTAVDSVTGYWVRARLSALSGTLTPPVQANRDIYSLNSSYIEIASTQVKGDIPAILQVKVPNQSDKDGPAGSAPNLWANRLLVGLRSYDRGENFQAYLNISDEQNPLGITVSVGTNTTFGDDVQTPTGRRATYAPAGAESMATRVTITFGPTIARDFYGTFHAFVRARHTVSVSSEITIRLQIASGSGGVSKTTDGVQHKTTTAFELLDFGQIQIPAAGNLRLTELGDSTVINIQASAENGTPDLYLYDLILIPTDEWSIDAVDKANESDSDIGRSNSIQKLLDIDSLTNPKYPIRALVREAGSGFVTSIYNPITPGEAILQANARQRLWFLAAQTSTTGTSYAWLSQSEIVHSIQLYKQERYLGLRGDR